MDRTSRLARKGSIVKVLIHSNAPWMPTGYGKQTAIAGAILKGLGHEVSYSAMAGLGGQPITWNGDAVYPSGQMAFSPDVVTSHAMMARADVIISLMDTYKLQSAQGQIVSMPIPFVPFTVVDCINPDGGPSRLDERLIRTTGALPVAVSEFGRKTLSSLAPEGWVVHVVNHAVDTRVFKPMNKAELREEMGTKDNFVIGIASANRDSIRKGFTEQFYAFSKFVKKHPEARLAVLSVHDSVSGLPLGELANDMGILDKTTFVPTYEQVSGLLDDEFMAAWYNALDVLSVCSYAEGFGVPLIEAQACGTPVVATRGSAMTELAGPAGWLVDGEPFWNGVHRAWWTRPSSDKIVKAWESAYKFGASSDRTEGALAVASRYDIPVVAEQWKNLMSQIEAYVETTKES